MTSKLCKTLADVHGVILKTHPHREVLLKITFLDLQKFPRIAVQFFSNMLATELYIRIKIYVPPPHPFEGKVYTFKI